MSIENLNGMVIADILFSPNDITFVSHGDEEDVSIPVKTDNILDVGGNFPDLFGSTVTNAYKEERRYIIVTEEHGTTLEIITKQ